MNPFVAPEAKIDEENLRLQHLSYESTRAARLVVNNFTAVELRHKFLQDTRAAFTAVWCMLAP